MSAVLTISPSSPLVSTTPDVAGTGFTDTYKTRLLLDGEEQMIVCYPESGVIAGHVTVADAAGTQTLTAQQYVAGGWVTVATLSVSVVAASTEAFSSDDQAAFQQLFESLDVNVIEIAAGTYHNWHLFVRNTRGSANALTVKPAAGAAVVWDNAGEGSGANGFLYLGANAGLPGVPTSVTDYVTFDTAGTGGTFTLKNYAIGATGLIYTGWVDHITLNGFRVLSCTGTATQNTSHCLYVSSDDTHNASNITANSWNVTGIDRTLNGIQTFHNPQVHTLSAASWTVTQLHRWAYLWGDATGITIDGWNGTSCDASIDAFVDGTQHAAGTVKNSNGHGSCGTLAVGSGFWVNTAVTDGGGNSA